MSTGEIQVIQNAILDQNKAINLNANAILKLQEMVELLPTVGTVQAMLDDVVTQSDAVADRVTIIENKLTKIALPSDTRYYMGEDELASLRSNINEMRVAKEELDKAKREIVVLLSRFDLTH